MKTNDLEPALPFLKLGKFIGKGKYGSVFYAEKNEITHYGKNELQEATNKVIKVQRRTHNGHDRMPHLKREAIFQNMHGVPTTLYLMKDKVLMIMDNCGANLEQFLSCKISFNKRVRIAKGIINEMSTLQKNGIVHCDIKTKNICIKELKGALQVFFIDFGFSIKLGEQIDSFFGTPLYMAQELFEDGDNSFASDMYALAAVLGFIFGAKDIFKNKKLKFKELISQGISDKKTRAQMSKEPLNFEGILEGYDTSEIDEGFKRDFLRLLEALSANDPNSRLSLGYVTKFFNHISYRVEGYQKHKQNCKAEPGYLRIANQLQKECEALAYEIGLLKKGKQISFSAEYFKSIEEAAESNSFVSEIGAEFPGSKNHIKRLKDRIHMFKTCKNQISMLKIYEEKIYMFPGELLDVIAKKDDKFLGTNSSGIETIKAVLSSQIKPIDQLKKLEEIGKNKTTGISARYSRSHFFGKGRHRNIEKLYKMLASLNLTKIANDSFESLDDKVDSFKAATNCLEGITKYIRDTLSFVNKKNYPKKSHKSSRCRAF